MRRSVRNALMLLGCLLVIGAAGGFAIFALNDASAAGTQPVTTALRVVRDDTGGIATLSTIAPTKVGSGPTLPAGTAVSVPSITLAAAMTPKPAPVIGATISCQLSVHWTSTSQVIDVVACTPTTPARN